MAMETAAPMTFSDTERMLRLDAIKAAHGAAPWVHELGSTNGTRAVLICQAPGHRNDTHYHEADEWWYIVEGAQTWTFLDTGVTHHVRAGDFIFAPARAIHHIEVVGDAPAIRLAMSAIGEFHRYDRPGCVPKEQA